MENIILDVLVGYLLNEVTLRLKKSCKDKTI